MLEPSWTVVRETDCITFLTLIQFTLGMPAKAMSNSLYNIRNYQSADFDKYVLLIAEAEKLAPTGRCVSPVVVAEQLKRPGYSPEQNLFILWSEDIAGYIDVRPELTIGRVVLDFWVHPQHRRRGLAKKLLSYATDRASLLGARAAHVNMGEKNVVAGRTLSGLGFSIIRQFLELRLDIADVGELDMARAILDSRYLQPGEEDKLTQLQNRALSGTWGYNPNTVEEIAFRVNSVTSSREDIVLAYEGNEAIGYCWTGISCQEGIPSVRKGRILMLGVAPDHRGEGMGRKLVLAALARLRSKGLQVAELTVDSENKAACGLYESIGFKAHASSSWYEKVID
jgi:mycothiol synthase